MSNQTGPRPIRARPRSGDYTTTELAMVLGCSAVTVAKLMDSGALPARQHLGARTRRVAHLDLVEWLANRPEHHDVLVQLCGPLPAGWGRPG